MLQHHIPVSNFEVLNQNLKDDYKFFLNFSVGEKGRWLGGGVEGLDIKLRP